MGIPADMPIPVRWHSTQGTQAITIRRTQDLLYNIEGVQGDRLTYVRSAFSRWAPLQTCLSTSNGTVHMGCGNQQDTTGVLQI